jgi:hypothetical protein
LQVSFLHYKEEEIAKKKPLYKIREAAILEGNTSSEWWQPIKMPANRKATEVSSIANSDEDLANSRPSLFYRPGDPGHAREEEDVAS